MRTAIPIYGTNGFTPEHLDLLKQENVARVILALDSDEAGRKATEALKETLLTAGVAVSVASFLPVSKTRTSSSSLETETPATSSGSSWPKPRRRARRLLLPRQNPRESFGKTDTSYFAKARFTTALRCIRRSSAGSEPR